MGAPDATAHGVSGSAVVASPAGKNSGKCPRRAHSLRPGLRTAWPWLCTLGLHALVISLGYVVVLRTSSIPDPAPLLSQRPYRVALPDHHVPMTNSPPQLAELQSESSAVEVSLPAPALSESELITEMDPIAVAAVEATAQPMLDQPQAAALQLGSVSKYPSDNAALASAAEPESPPATQTVPVADDRGTPTRRAGAHTDTPSTSVAATSGAGAARASNASERPEQPALLSRTTPVYPEAARRAGREGAVRISMRIDATGAVVESGIATTSGDRSLDESAVAAVRDWRFARSTAGGTTSETIAYVWITFSLR